MYDWRQWTYFLLLCAPLFLPVGVWAYPPLDWADHTRTWWYNHTPKCWGPVCVNAYYDHVVIEIELPLPRAGASS